jgi:hypothetical protein
VSKDRQSPELTAWRWLKRAARKEAQAAKTKDLGYRGVLLRETAKLREKAQRVADGV